MGTQCVCVLSRVRLFVTPGTVAYQALLSMKFLRQKYRSRLPFSSPEDLPTKGLASGFFTTSATSEP